MFELFHAISDASSARVRKYVVDHDLAEVIRFRNVHYEEVKSALQERGGTNAPAMWDGEKLIEGADAIIARLQAHSDVGRS